MPAGIFGSPVVTLLRVFSRFVFRCFRRGGSAIFQRFWIFLRMLFGVLGAPFGHYFRAPEVPRRVFWGLLAYLGAAGAVVWESLGDPWETAGGLILGKCAVLVPLLFRMMSNSNQNPEAVPKATHGAPKGPYAPADLDKYFEIFGVPRPRDPHSQLHAAIA